jgi:hypothetical protein
LEQLDSGQPVEISPRAVARERWVNVTVRCPPGPFAIVARDETDGSWFGFREPVEIGWPSAAAAVLIENSRAPLVALVSLAVLGLAIRWP